MEKQLGWCESLGISKAGQTVLARLMESQIWHQLAGSVALLGEGSEKGQWPLLTPYLTLQPLPVCHRCLSGYFPYAGAQRE